MQNNTAFTLIFFRIFVALLLLNGCEGNLWADTPVVDLNTRSTEGGNRLTITRVDELMNAAKNMAKSGPSFDAPIEEPLDTNSAFKQTPMGAYLDNWFPEMPNSEKISAAAPKILNYLVKTDTCHGSCSIAFMNEVNQNKEALEKRLQEISRHVAENELRNLDRFSMFYTAFPNELRLYQDVLRIIKSFEFLTTLNTTYPFRDFAFKDARLTLPDFLKNWWQEYLNYAMEKGVPPFPTEGYEALGQHVGLTFFPDSIPYAQQHVFSVNVNFLGNNLSPKNSTVFYFLNSISATTQEGEDRVKTFLERSLTPYIRTADGQFDKAKFEKVLASLKEIFNRTMNNSGGQLAQILVDKSAVPEISYMAWNGGEPMWISNSTGKIIMATDSATGKSTFMPTNVFWPTTEEQIADYKLSNVVDFMNLYINEPQKLTEVFHVTRRRLVSLAAKMVGTEVDSPRSSIYASQDYAQARILPNPKFFTDENITGVKMFTYRPVEPDVEATYNTEIFNVLRDVFADFLATAKESDFKEGTYKLKNAFIEAMTKVSPN